MLVRVTGWVWWAVAFSTLALALLVLLARLFVPSYITNNKTAIEQRLAEYIEAPVEIQHLEASWDGFYPYLNLRNLTSRRAGFDLEIASLDAELDPLGSLLNLSPVFHTFTINKPELHLSGSEWAPGQLSLKSLNSEPNDQAKLAEPVLKVARKLIEILKLQPEVTFSQAKLRLSRANHPDLSLNPITFTLRNQSEQHHFSGVFAMEMAGEVTSAEFALETSGFPDDPLQANYRLYLKLKNLGKQLLDMNLFEMPVEVSALDMGTELWAEIEGARLASIIGRVQLDELAFAEENNFDSLKNSHFNFFVIPKGDGYQLGVTDFLLKNSDHRIDLAAVFMQMGWQGQELTPRSLVASQIDFGQLDSWLSGKPYLPAVLNRALVSLKPVGLMRNLEVNWQNNDWLDFSAEADLQQVTLGDYFGAPALTNINGRMSFSPNQGSIHLNSQKFGLYFPDLFPKAWQYDSAAGQISWQIETREGHTKPVVTVNSGLINLMNSDLQAAGRFSMFLPLDRQHQTELSMMIALKNARASAIADYVPPEEVGQSLHQWIDGAIKGGRINEAMLLLRTDTRSALARSPLTAQLFFDIAKADVKFLPDWPAVKQTDLQVSIKDGAVSASAKAGSWLNSSVEQVDMVLDPKEQRLAVQAKVAGPAGDLKTVLAATGLDKKQALQLEGWDLEGEHQSQVKVSLPVKNPEDFNIKVVSDIKDGTLKNQADKLQLKRINGRFNYETDQGLSAKSIAAEFLGAPYRLAISTKTGSAKKTANIQLDFAGNLSLERLSDWLDMSLYGVVDGASLIKGKVNLCGSGCSQLVINSNLKGIALNLPQPFAKKRSAVKSFQLVTPLDASNPVWRYNLANQLRGVTRSKKDGSYTLLQLGGARPDEPLQKGVHIKGQLAEIDIEAWADTLADFNQAIADEKPAQKSSTKASAVSLGHNSVSLSVQNLKYQNISLEHVDLLLKTQEKEFQLGFSSPALTGTAVTSLGKGSKALSDVWDIRLNHIRLDAFVANAQASALQDKAKDKQTAAQRQSSSTLPIVLPKQLPDFSDWPYINLTLGKAMWHQKDLGQWSVNFDPNRSGEQITDIQGLIAGFKMTGQAGWRKEQSGLIRSRLDLILAGENLGEIFSALGYDNVLESKAADLSVALNWQGLPWDYSTETLAGDFRMDLRKGRIIESGKSTNLLRLFGILNFNTLARRLNLNFNDLVEKGLSYDKMTSHFAINDGLMTTVEDLSLEGPSADIKFRGDVDLPRQSLNANMEVALPLTGNIPLVAVLMGAPHIAGAAFILDKLFGGQLQKVSTLIYQISGPWDEPNVVPLKAAKAPRIRTD